MASYNYHPITGEYIPGPNKSWMSTTTTAPPVYDTNVDTPFFVNGAWVLQPNIKLSDVQASQISLMEQGYEISLCKGFASSATGTSLIYCKSDTVAGVVSAQTDLIGVYQTISITGASQPFLAWDSTGINRQSVTLTQIEAQTIITDGAAYKQALVAYLEQQKAAINSATSISAVQAITWNPPV